MPASAAELIEGNASWANAVPPCECLTSLGGKTEGRAAQDRLRAQFRGLGVRPANVAAPRRSFVYCRSERRSARVIFPGPSGDDPMTDARLKMQDPRDEYPKPPLPAQ